MNAQSSRLLFILDLSGIAVFELEGALAAIDGNLDFFGVMVLSFATALGGGVIRDLLINATPPNAIRDWRYSAVAFAAGSASFFFYDTAQRIPSGLLTTLDAAGLALFAVAGTEKALDFKIHPFIATLMGTITGVGGGTIRDMFLNQVPLVLRADVYATAALGGAAVVVGARKLKLPGPLASILGGTVCFLLRMISVWRHWNLPRVGLP
jgi:uncharacterized membrane protein YeiH